MVPYRGSREEAVPALCGQEMLQGAWRGLTENSLRGMTSAGRTGPSGQLVTELSIVLGGNSKETKSQE